MNEFESFLNTLEEIRKRMPKRTISAKAQKMKDLGYESVLYLCPDGVIRAIYPGDTIPGTNIVPIPRRE